MCAIGSALTVRAATGPLITGLNRPPGFRWGLESVTAGVAVESPVSSSSGEGGWVHSHKELIMKWRKLVPVSLGCTFVGVGVVATFTPKPAAAETANCGKNDGNECHKKCELENSDGSCKSWSYQYYPK